VQRVIVQIDDLDTDTTTRALDDLAAALGPRLVR
jgi:hypothetical protein